MKKIRNGLLAVIVLLLAVIGFMVFSILQRQEPEVVPGETAATVAETQATEAETEPVQVEVTRPVARDYRVVEVKEGVLETPFGSLSYPAGLSDHLLVVCTCEEPYTLEFCAVMEGRQELRLFDLSLGEGSGGNLGLAVTEAGEVPLNVTIYELTADENWTEGELLTAQAMQDAVNELLQQLAPKAKAAPQTVMQQQPQEEVTLHNLEFETPYGTLYYPARWTGMVRAEQETTGDGVHRVYFYAQPEQLLFAIYFGGDEAEQVGAIMGPDGIPVTVNLSMGRLSSDAEETLFRMQEDANQLIAKLPLLQ